MRFKEAIANFLEQCSDYEAYDVSSFRCEVFIPELGTLPLHYEYSNEKTQFQPPQIQTCLPDGENVF